MKLSEAIEKIDKSKNNEIHPFKICESLGFYDYCPDSLKAHVITGSVDSNDDDFPFTGIAAYYLNDELIAIGEHTDYGDENSFFWESKESRIKLLIALDYEKVKDRFMLIDKNIELPNT